MTLNELRRIVRITATLDGDTPVHLHIGSTDTELGDLDKITIENDGNSDFVELYINGTAYTEDEQHQPFMPYVDEPEMQYGIVEEAQTEIKSKHESEREMYTQALQGRSNREAARILGVSERTIYRKRKEYNL